MKLRLEENSLRLRLSEAEVQQFAATGRVAYSIAFGPGPAQTLLYSLERLPAASPATAVQVRYEAGALAVEVPDSVARNWTGTENIGFKGLVLVAEGRELRILVEKDLDSQH
ncbi:hypothetical protein GCM10023172_38570 [Hymenobacter ginsengisoli]|uniref:Uncharacterized protein n=1 Tax=Hymenobacter ginsengisoli TaxID=1051626 RepID=A0ABP8QSL9_9BACT|nr:MULTISPECIES: hypothetical protein [unclassified Hymenobacter]MBO2033008.1 hypothetical protein [Hymenobacter sp. BT559]